MIDLIEDHLRGLIEGHLWELIDIPLYRKIGQSSVKGGIVSYRGAFSVQLGLSIRYRGFGFINYNPPL